MATNRDERMKEITDRLQAGLDELFNSEKYTEYLRVMSQFHHYSFNNTLLIAMQKPDATLVAGYHAWEKKFNRHVLKGEKGIQIIAPAPVKEKQEQEKVDPESGEVILREDGQPETEEVTIVIPRFKVSTVFDLSQTDGDPLPELGVNELVANVENYDMFLNAVRSVAPVLIRFDEIRSGAKGYYDNANKEIVIQSGMSEMQTMKTAVHETAHAILHDRDFMQEQGIQKDQMTREVEAESVAFVSLAHFELDTSDYSFPYIAGWSSGRDTKELKASMDTIRKTSSEIIDGIEASLREQLLERQNAEISVEPIQEDSADIIVDGHEGTWKTIQSQEINGEMFYLMESQEYGADVANILLHKNRDLVAEDLWNGIDYDAMQAVQEYFSQKEIAYSLTDFPLQERFSIHTQVEGFEKPVFFVVDNVTGAPLGEKGDVTIYSDRIALMEKMKEMNLDKSAIYRNSASYAHEHDELDSYRFSMQENRACKEGIEKVIRENFDGMHLDPKVVKPVIDRFGAERVAYVLANTVQLADWDGRYSQSNKEWAAPFSYPEESTAFDTARRSFAVSSHPAVLDGFCDLFRKEVKERGLEMDGAVREEKPFIDHFYVVEDLEVQGQLAVKEYPSCEEALAAYFDLPNSKRKALGIQNTNPLPGSLDFIHCVNGIDTAIMDYTFFEVWNNPEIQETQSEIEYALALHDTEIAYELPGGFATVESVENGYKYQLYDLNFGRLESGIVDCSAEGEPAKSLEGVVREIGDELRINFDDWRVIDYQKFTDQIKAVETTRLQESVNHIEKPEGLAIGYDAGFITVQRADSGYDYTIYNLKCRPIDGGVLESPDLTIHEAMTEILNSEGLDAEETWEASYDTIMIEADEMEEATPPGVNAVSFFVAENMEFPVMGEYHEVETLKEAVKLFSENEGGKLQGIGIALNDGTFPLVVNEKGMTKMTDLVGQEDSNPLVLQAFEEAKLFFEDGREAEHRPHEMGDKDTADGERGVEKRPQPARIEKVPSIMTSSTASKTEGKKESVLKALRDRQALIKEREKQTVEQKTHERKKGEHTL